MAMLSKNIIRPNAGQRFPSNPHNRQELGSRTQAYKCARIIVGKTTRY
ncbi:MAG: hypothetical protein QXJ64_09250 [Thermosphaera sp.]